MSDIEVDRDGMQSLLDRQVGATDELDRRLAWMPPPPDGGMASGLIGFLASAAAEAASAIADSTRGLSGLADDVMNDLALSDAAAAQIMTDFEEELG